MTLAKKFLNKLNENLVQYTGDRISTPVGNSHPALEPGIYDISINMMGMAQFEKREVKSDILLNLRSNNREMLISEFKKFWDPETKSKFEKMGFTHKRGFIYEGPPGTGKSCDMKLLMNEMVSQGDIVFIPKHIGDLRECLKQFKEVEPNRHVAVIMEDFEKDCNYHEHSLLELLDGPNSVNGIFYLATTNHINQISERMKRKSRFDRVIHVGLPEYEDRLEYLRNKLSVNETEDQIAYLAKVSEGSNFADLKDMLVSIYCLQYSVDQTIKEMKEGKLKKTGSKYDESSFSNKFTSSIKRISLNETKFNGITNKGTSDYLIKVFKNVWGFTPDNLKIEDVQEVPVMSENKSIAKKLSELIDRELEVTDPDTVEEPTSPSTPTGNMPNDPEGLVDGWPVDPGRTRLDFEKRLGISGIEGINLDDLDFNDKGEIFFSISDLEGNTGEFSMSVDDDGSYILVKDGEEIDLDNLSPSISTTALGKYINTSDLSWLDKTTLMKILQSTGMKALKDGHKVTHNVDAFGNKMAVRPGV
jgi:hypothetical protein